ncbi:MAG: HD family phosphohydrolase, partial [Desulfovibrionaceae bacterium]|nr:HD family phosphohydrolase [Desulfovibrionaceae bacterium]
SRAGRLTAVADSFSAMICQRAYAPAKEPLEAAKELAADSQRYDTEITKLLFSALVTESFGSFVDMDKCADEAV